MIIQLTSAERDEAYRDYIAKRYPDHEMHTWTDQVQREYTGSGSRDKTRFVVAIEIRNKMKLQDPDPEDLP